MARRDLDAARVAYASGSAELSRAAHSPPGLVNRKHSAAAAEQDNQHPTQQDDEEEDTDGGGGAETGINQRRSGSGGDGSASPPSLNNVSGAGDGDRSWAGSLFFQEAHKLIRGKYIKIAVFSGLDGVLSILSLQCVLTAAGLSSRVVVYCGVALTLAYGGSKGLAECMNARVKWAGLWHEKRREAWELDNFCEGEVEEMVEVYQEKGFSEHDSRRVIEILAQNKSFFVDHMLVYELNMLPPDPQASPVRQGLVGAAAFMIGGGLSLLTYLLYGQTLAAIHGPVDRWDYALFASFLFNHVVLFAIGAMRGHMFNQPWLWCGLSTVVNGLLAWAAGYWLGGALVAQPFQLMLRSAISEATQTVAVTELTAAIGL